MKFSDLETFPIKNFQKINDRERSILKQQIMEYYDSVHIQFTSKEVQKHLIDLNSEVVPLNTIAKIMKQDWSLTYKRWLSRSNSIDFDRVNALRWMFSVEFSLN